MLITQTKMERSLLRITVKDVILKQTRRNTTRMRDAIKIILHLKPRGETQQSESHGIEKSRKLWRKAFVEQCTLSTSDYAN